MKHLAQVHLEQGLFKQLCDVCAKDPAMPKTWDAWTALINEATVLAEQAGEHLAPLTLRPATFCTWCEHVGIVPGMDALKAYAMAARTPVSKGSVRLTDSGPNNYLR